MNKRPGVMLYFDRLSFLNQLSEGQTGTLFKAVIAYARDGSEPIFQDDMVKLAWEFLRPGLDQDEKRYQEVCEKRRKAAEKRWAMDRARYPIAYQSQTELQPQPQLTTTAPDSNPDTAPAT